MFFIFRAGRRMMARSGGPRQGPPQQWGWLGKTIFTVLFIGTWCEINWQSFAWTAGILAGVILLLILFGAGKHKAPVRDKLDDLMDEYARKEGTS